MLGEFFVGFGGLACFAWRLVALCRWPPHPKTAQLSPRGLLVDSHSVHPHTHTQALAFDVLSGFVFTSQQGLSSMSSKNAGLDVRLMCRRPVLDMA
jgi:hypothetical protein